MKNHPTTPDAAALERAGETGISRVAWSVVVIGVVATALAGWLGGARALAGVAAGALIGIANLFALAFLVRRLIAPTRPKGQWGLAAALKLVGLLAGVFLLL